MPLARPSFAFVFFLARPPPLFHRSFQSYIEAFAELKAIVNAGPAKSISYQRLAKKNRVKTFPNRNIEEPDSVRCLFFLVSFETRCPAACLTESLEVSSNVFVRCAWGLERRPPRRFPILRVVVTEAAKSVRDIFFRS